MTYRVRRIPNVADPLHLRFGDRPVLSSSNAFTEAQIIQLGPTLFLDERELTITAADYSNWGNQASPGTDTNDFAAPTVAARPLTGSLIGGFASPRFIASGQAASKRMNDVSGSWTTVLNENQYSIFVVVSCSLLSGTNAQAYANPGIWGDSSQFLGLYSNTIASSSGYQLYNWDVNEKSTTSIPIATGSIQVVEAHFQSGSRSELRSNNYITQSATPISTIGDTAGSLALGGTTTSVINGFNGGIASVIAFNKILDARSRRGVREYLANKYGVTLVDGGVDAPQTPAQYFGNALTVWCAASMGVSGSPISTWVSNGSISCFMSAAGGARPAQSVQNGLVTPLFNGINNVLSSYSDVAGTTFLPFASASGTGQWEILITGIANALSGSGVSADMETNIFSCQTNASHGISVTSNGSRTYTTTTNGQVVTPFTSGTLAPFERFLIHSYYDGTNLISRLNDNIPVSASQTGNIASATDEILLGRDSSVGPDFNFNGNVFEFMIFSQSLNITQRNWVRTYLGNKWGVYY